MTLFGPQLSLLICTARDRMADARSTSATLHACATQPRGVNGGSASKTSLIVPMHASPSAARKPSRKRRRAVVVADAPCSHASMNGPISQPQTVPW